MARGKSSYGGSERTMRNAAQTLLANIRFASVDDPVRTLVITSSVPSEGKTTISLELARVVASSGSTVLLVECDMRRRSMAATIGVHPQRGLYSVLSGASDLASTAVSIDKNFWFLDVEPHIPNPPDIIASRRFKSFVEDVRQRFNFVIFDTPPLAAFVDAAVLSSVVDGTVMVVRERFTKRSELQDAYAQLQNAGANVVGVCMNYCEEERSEYYYAYYDKQGSRVDTSGLDDEEEKALFNLPVRAPRHGSAQPKRARVMAEATVPNQSEADDTAVTLTSMPVNRTRPAAGPTVGSQVDIADEI